MVYRSPSHNNEKEFVSKLEEILSKISNENKEIIILGDFNMDLLKTDSHNATSELLDTMMNYQLTPRITSPTRVTHSTATLIDHIYKNMSDKKCIAGTLLNDITDHYINFIFNENKAIMKMPRRITYRPVTNANIDKFNLELEKINWTSVLDSNNPSVAYDIYLKKYHSALDLIMPLKTVLFDKRKHKKQPWITFGILKSIQTKSKLYKDKMNAASEQQRIISTEIYNKYRNLLNKIIRTAKSFYWEKIFNESKADMKQTWKNINNILRKNQNKTNFPSSFLHEGANITDHKDIANAFNKYFIDVGSSLASKIPNVHTNRNTMPTLSQSPSFFMTPTTEYEIMQIIKKLKPKTSCGFDEISSKLIKNSSMIIAAPLAHVINLSLLNGIVPTQMKIAKVIPTYKNNENNLLKNYRPISLLPTFSKILEKIVYKRLYMFLQKYELLYDSQYGFRKNLSTELAILEFQNRIIRSLENQNYTLGLFLDLSKAFDTLQHNILLNKLEHYGIRGNALNWFKSYLTGREQYVSYQGVNSERISILCGVPQGSVLGPLLFLIYTNDLHNISNYGKYILFADDTNIIFNDTNLQNLARNVTNELNEIGKWFNMNKLSVNVSKTTFILFSKTRIQQGIDIELKLNNILIEPLHATKFLGVIIQHDFSWEKHISKVCKKISQVNCSLSRLKNTLPTNILETIYRSLIEPHLTYAIVSWGNAPDKYLKRLKTLQKRSIRTINKSAYNSHTEPIFKSRKILKLEHLFEIACCKLYYKKMRSIIPLYHTEELLTHEERNHPPRITRQLTNVYIHPIKTQLNKQMINYSVGHAWNNLPMFIKEKHTFSLSTFSNFLKNYFLSKYNEQCNIQNCYICHTNS